MNHEQLKENQAEDRDHFSQKDIQNGLKTIGADERAHAALETPDGKNNGAEPAAFKGQRKYTT